MIHPADDAIRSVIHNTAVATIELCAERIVEQYTAHTLARYLLRSKDALANEVVGVAMECADEDSESVVHAARAAAAVRR